MKIHYLQHVPFEGLGSIQAWATSRGIELACTRLFEADPLPWNTDIDLLVVLGGPMGVDGEQGFPWLKEEKLFLKKAVESKIKILGICLGAQLLAQALGAKVIPNAEKEIGWQPIESVPSSIEHPVAKILTSAGEVFHWHGDTFTLPKEAILLAKSAGCLNQAFAVGKNILAFQFHLETTLGSAKELIKNCGHEITKARFIQPANEMLKDDAKFKRINSLMEACLDCFLNRQY